MLEIANLPFEEELKGEMDAQCSIASFDAGQQIVGTGSYMSVIPFVLEGSIRVFRREVDLDRELLLYYIGPGETCMMSLVACFGDNISKVNAVTEKKSDLLMVPTDQVRAWQIKYTRWNRFVIDTFMNRYTELLEALEEISFKKIDERLQRYLKDYASRHVTKTVKRTHREIANELGTSRVVVSRLLKNMEQTGMLDLRRGVIRLKDL